MAEHHWIRDAKTGKVTLRRKPIDWPAVRDTAFVLVAFIGGLGAVTMVLIRLFYELWLMAK